MSEIVVSCSCCGRQMLFPSECVLLECPACGTRNARPRSTGAELNILKRAVDQRLACDFHNAEKSYQHVLLEHPDEHEALWGLLLCHYGVEYVEDPVTHHRMPTVHTVRTKPLQAQADFRYACDAAPPEVRAQYELDAAYIDDAQTHIRQLAKSCEPYDVFLCHKTTKPGSSEKTEDYQRALELYYFLQGYGIRVFFAPMSLQSAAGANYEAGIYHALHTAKVMLVFCSDADHLTSAWVRSEWSRFLEMMDETQGKRLIPLLYDHFEPSRLPRPFFIHRLQGLDMTKLDAPYNLLKSVQAAVGKEAEPPAPESPKQAEAPQPRPEPVRPQPVSEPVAPPSPSAGAVTVLFPNPHPMRPDLKELELMTAPNVFEPAEWGKALTIPAEYSTEYQVNNAKKRRSNTFYLLLMIVGAIVSGVMFGIGLGSFGSGLLFGVFMFIMMFIMLLPAMLIGIKQLSFTVTPGSCYTLYWKKHKNTYKLGVKEN